MREALALLHQRAPELEVDGEMHGDAALDPEIRAERVPELAAQGRRQPADLPNLDAANIAFNLLKTRGRRPADRADAARRRARRRTS